MACNETRHPADGFFCGTLYGQQQFAPYDDPRNLPHSPEVAKDEKGIWSITVGPLEPAIYSFASYSFAVDGAIRIPGPANPAVERVLTAASE